MTTAFPSQVLYASEYDFQWDGVIGTARRQSREWDYGVWHRDTDKPHPVYRISYILDTYEVVAVCLGGKPRGTVEVLASGVPQGELERLLHGWAEVCGPFSMPWIRERLKAYPVCLASTV